MVNKNGNPHLVVPHQHGRHHLYHSSVASPISNPSMHYDLNTHDAQAQMHNGNKRTRNQKQSNLDGIQSSDVIESIRSLQISTQKLVSILANVKHKGEFERRSNYNTKNTQNVIHIKGRSSTIFSCYFIGNYHILVTYVQIGKFFFKDFDYFMLDQCFNPFMSDIMVTVHEMDGIVNGERT